MCSRWGRKDHLEREGERKVGRCEESALSLLSKVVSASRFISHQVYSPHTCLLAHKMDVTILSKREGLLSILPIGRGDSGSSACVKHLPLCGVFCEFWAGTLSSTVECLAL